MDIERSTSIASSSSSRKRKQPDEDEPLGNERLNDCDYLDDDDDVNEEKTILRAQQPSTVARDDGIQITPFNLDEEREEGEFDREGTFIFKKKSHKHKHKDDLDCDDDDSGEERDVWAESIDWAAVEQRGRGEKDEKNFQTNSTKVGETEDRKSPKPTQTRLSCYKQMLRIMRPDETVQRAIIRLGNEMPKRRPKRLSGSSNKSMEVDSNEVANVVETKRKLELMIELAHQRLKDGDTDIYQRSYEALEEAIN